MLILVVVSVQGLEKSKSKLTLTQAIKNNAKSKKSEKYFFIKQDIFAAKLAFGAPEFELNFAKLRSFFIEYEAMLNRTLLVTLLLSQTPVFSQNLVLNPSFEQLKPGGVVVACEFMQSGRLAEVAEAWTGFVDMTPDVLRAAENCPLLTQVHSGEYCGGIIYYLPGKDSGHESGYREALQGQLMRPLRPGVRYRVGAWFREDPTLMKDHLARVYTAKTPIMPLKASNIGFCFSVTPFDAHYSLASHIRDLNLKPQVNFGEIIATNGDWVYLSATFVADRPFQYFTIANFFRDEQTATNLPPHIHRKIDSLNAKAPSTLMRTKRVAYVCIDDVYIGPEKPSAPDTASPKSLETKMLRERKFTFSAAVLFDSGKADLRPAAGPELDSLAAFLKKYPRIRVGISGHTDDVGTDADNLDLSARRAQAVYTHLLTQSIPAAQIEWKAFGETRPIAENTTEEGRQRNRRVECVVLK